MGFQPELLKQMLKNNFEKHGLKAQKTPALSLQLDVNLLLLSY